MAAFILDSPLLVPVLTTLVGAGSLTVGLYSFFNLAASARIYGIPVSTTSSTGILPDLTTFLISPPSVPPSTTDDKTNSTSTSTSPWPTTTHFPQPSPLPQQTHTLLHSLAIRNVAIGGTILSLTSAYYQFAFAGPADPHLLLFKRYTRQLLGSVIMGGSVVPFIDAQSCWMSEGGGGRRAMWLHVLRGVGWVVVGVWCYFGW